MPKPVAVEGDTQFETSSAKHGADTNQSGQWGLVSSSVTAGTKIKVDGKLVELGASASWSYAGGTATAGTSAVPVGPFPDQATLTAVATKLKDNGKDILLDGDEATGALDSGNKILVSASQSKLKTD